MNHKRLNNLIHVKRYSGVPLVKEESVADHVWGMVALAYEQIPDINDARVKIGLDPVNIKELIYKITIHDIGENYTGDLIRTFKYNTTEIHEVVDRTEEKMMREMLPGDFVDDILNAKDNTIEGRYVRILDFVQAGLKMKFESRLGNRFMRDQLKNVIESLTELRDTYIPDPTLKVEVDFITKYIVSFKSVVNE